MHHHVFNYSKFRYFHSQFYFFIFVRIQFLRNVCLLYVFHFSILTWLEKSRQYACIISGNVSFDVNLSSSYSLIYHHPPIPLFIYTKSCNLIIQVSWKFHTCHTNYVLGKTPMAQCNCQFTDGNSSLVAFFLNFRCLLLCLRCCIYC